MTWEEKQITTENDCKACSHVRIVTCGKRRKKKIGLRIKETG